MNLFETLTPIAANRLNASILKPYAQCYLDHLNAQGYARNTVRLYLNCLAHFAHWTKQQQILRLCGYPHNRKNFLFLGSDNGGERAATLYSLLGSTKLNNVSPEKYLTHVINVMADHPNSKVADLLPWNVSL